MSLPTRSEMFRNARIQLDHARVGLENASAWLSSPWRPVGSPLSNTQATARMDARRILAEIDGLMTEAARALEATVDD